VPTAEVNSASPSGLTRRSRALRRRSRALSDSKETHVPVSHEVLFLSGAAAAAGAPNAQSTRAGSDIPYDAGPDAGSVEGGVPY
jgi:hypothetical protein